MFEAQFRQRTNPVSAEQAEAALQSLPPATQAGVANLVADHGAGAREHLAYQATGEWTAGEREALRTLAAATPNVRAEAISGVLDSSDEHATAQSDPTSATSTQEQSTSGDAGAASGTGAPPAEHEHVTLGELGAPVSGGDPIEQPPVENGGGSNGGQTGSQPGNGGTAGGGTPSSAPNPVEQPGALGTEGLGSAAGGGTPSSSPNPGGQPGSGQPGSVSGPPSGGRGGGGVPPAREPRGPDPNDRSES